MRIPVLTLLALVALAMPTSLLTAGASGPLPVGFAVYPASGGLGTFSGEPSLGYDPASQHFFMQAGSQILKVSFDDSTAPASALWTNSAGGVNEEVNVDPIASVDASTGRVFAGGLEGGCSLLSISDDDGASWTASPDYCTVPAFDHPTVGSGPWHELPGSVANPATYPRAVYYCAQGDAQECATSWDGGLTFNPPAVITTACTGAVGHVKVAPDGTAYVPAKGCGAKQDVMVTTNNGLTWATHPITSSTVASGFNDPSVGVSAQSGWVYAAWLGSNNHIAAAVSKDQGLTWSAAKDLGASLGLTGGSFATVVAGDDQRAAVAFLGTAGSGSPFAQSFQGTWDLYVATTTDGGVSWTTTKVTTDPVQRGWICTQGTTCPTDTTTLGQPGRNLLDFMDATLDARGRVVVGFADGCVDACAASGGTIAESQSALATIARQTCGPSLYASVGDVETGTTCPTGTPPPPGDVKLTGTFYAHGIAPVGNPDGLLEIALPGDTLTPAAPATGAPRVYSNAGPEHGSNGGTIYDAHWALSNNGVPYVLNDSTVTAHIWISAQPGSPALATTVRVVLFDMNEGGFADVTHPLAQQDIVVPVTPNGVQDLVVTFPGLTTKLQNGLELWMDDVDGADVQAYYDSATTPTRIEVS